MALPDSATLPQLTAPASDEYNEYYHQYISLLPAEQFWDEFAAQPDQLRDLLEDRPRQVLNTPHAPYTWTLKQVLGHLIDCERIFSTRLLRIAVGDETPIPGINQDIYVDNLDYESVEIGPLLDEFAALRQANLLLARRLGPEALQRRGLTSNQPVSARANLFILGGHVIYHLNIMRQRLAAV